MGFSMAALLEVMEGTSLFLTVSPEALSAEGPPILTHALAAGGDGDSFLLPRAPALFSKCSGVGSLGSASFPHLTCAF